VLAVDRDLRSEEQLGRALTDAAGAYRIGYSAEQLRRAERGSADLVVRAVDPLTAAPLAASPVLFNAPADAVVDLVIPAEAMSAPSLFERIAAALPPLLGGLETVAIEEDEAHQDLTFLAGEAGFAKADLARFVQAQLLARQAVAVEFWFALLGDPLAAYAEGRSLEAQRADLLRTLPGRDATSVRKVLTAAFERGDIAAGLRARTAKWTAEFLAFAARQHLQGEAGPSFVAPALDAAGIADPARREAFAGLFVKHGGMTRALVDALAREAAFKPAEIADLSASYALAGVANGEVALVRAIKTAFKVADPEGVRALARKSREEWTGFAESMRASGQAGLAVFAALDPKAAQPGPEVQGALLETQFRQAFPTAAFAGGFERALQAGEVRGLTQAKAVSGFLDAHPDFELLNTPVRDYLGESTAPKYAKLAQDEAFIAELEATQRVFKLAPSAEATLAMLGDGVHSAQQVYRLGEGSFVGRYGGLPGFCAEAATMAWGRAADTYAATLTLVGDLIGLNGEGLPAALLNNNAALAGFPNWQKLFQGGDLCACEACRSVTSPAAYFADLLTFLKDRVVNGRSVKDVVFDRRPDLGFIELDCDNAMVPLPYVDVVNEVLEAAIAQGASDVQLTGLNAMPAPEAALIQALEAAQLRPGAHVTMVQISPADPNRWVVHGDETSFLLSRAGAGDFIARILPNTKASAEELRAAPAYVDPAAYAVLRAASYPSELPFDLFAEEVRAGFGKCNLKRWELMLDLRHKGPPSGTIVLPPPIPSEAQVAAEYFGINVDPDPQAPLDEMRLILTAKPGDQQQLWGETGNNLWLNYSFAVPNATLPPANVRIALVKTFLIKSKLEYDELLTLLDQRFVNPAGTIYIEHRDGSCDTDKKVIRGLDANALDRIHRFLRLWRKLDWKMWEVDFAIMSPGVGGGSLDEPFLINLFHVGRLRERFGRSAILEHICALCGDLNVRTHFTKAYKPRGDAVYQQLFLNKRLVNPLDPAFEVARVTATASTAETLAGHLPALLAGLRVSAADLGIFEGLTRASNGNKYLANDELKLGNISFLWRHAWLARQFKLKPAEWATALKLLRLDVERFADARAAFAFVERLDLLLGVGFSVDQLDWVIAANRGARSAPKTADAARFLTALRKDLQAIAAEYDPAQYPFLAPIPGPPTDEASLTALLTALLAKLGRDEASTAEVLTVIDVGVLAEAKVTGMPTAFIFPTTITDSPNFIPIAFDEAAGVLRFRRDMSQAERAILLGSSLPATVTGNPSYVAAIAELDERTRQIRNAVKFFDLRVSAPLDDLPGGVDFKSQLPDDLAAKVEYHPDRRTLGFAGVMSGAEKAALEALAPSGPPGAAYRAAVASLADQPDSIVPWDSRVWFKDTDIMTIGRAKRLADAASKLLAYLAQTRSAEAVVQKYAAQLGLSETMTHGLVTEYPIVWGASILGDLLWPFASSTGPVDETASAMRKTINGWFWAMRTATLWKGWKVSEADVRSLAALQAGAGLLLTELLPRDAAFFETQQPPAWVIAKLIDPFLRTARLLRLRASLPEAGIALFAVLGKLDTGAYATPAEFADDVALLSDGAWKSPDVGILVSELDLAYPSQYLLAETWERLRGALGFIAALGADAPTALAFAEPAMRANHAATLRALLRAKFGTEAWLTLSTEIQDRLRERKRDSLTAYLLVHPELAPARAAGEKWENSNDLYAYFLLDVEMCACQLTSRLVQASGSLQLFVQRCLMGLESQVPVDADEDTAWRWWAWMRKYRVWQANREVFLWPENWIEPELKPDRSPFFKDLENELLQNEINRDNVETAFAAYLEKLDGVAQLEPAGFYQEDDGDEPVVHVFARTRGAEPHLYYYRRFDYRSWSPWERVEVDIHSDYLIPAVVGKRLFLFWPVFREIPDEQANQSIPTPSANSTAPLARVNKRLCMELAMSDFRQGKWTPKRTSRDYAQSVETFPQELAKRGYQFYAIDSSAIDNRFGILYDGWSLTATNVPTARLSGAFELAGCTGAPVAAHFPYVLAPASFPDPVSVLPPGYPNGLPPLCDYQHWSEAAGRLDASEDDFTLVRWRSWTGHYPAEIFKATPGLFQVTPPRQLSYLDMLTLDGPGDPSSWTTYVGSLLPFFYNDQQRTFFVLPAARNMRCGNVGPTDDPERIYYPEILRTVRAEQRQTEPQLRDQIARANPTMPAAEVDKWWRIWLKSYHGYLGSTSLERYAGQLLHFRTFYHPFVCDFARLVNNPLEGIPGLMRRQTQLKDSGFSFRETYRPSSWVLDAGSERFYPREDVDFSPDGAYSLYNWELFFHAPLLIANALSRNQQFAEAQEWYHFIFNPIGVDSPIAGGSAMSRYWITKPFFLTTDPQYVAQRIERMLLLLAGDTSAPGYSPQMQTELNAQVRDSRKDPFQPHRIAAYRTVAYQKNVVMKYLDNLIAWADNLFAQDSMESINEATQLYILAAEILGPAPREVPPPAKPPVETFNELEASFDDLSNALIQVENLVPLQVGSGSAGTNSPPLPMLYFCIPQNSKMLRYWDVVADRLYKIRHCMNIEGVVRQLALFEPPIDPAALVKAVAGGADIGSALADLNAPLPHYRFATYLQKANEICNDVKALGGALLSAIEKRDSEALGQLRQVHELGALKASVAVREQQIAEAKENLEGSRKSKVIAETRRDYYRDIEQLTSQEKLHLDKLAESHKKAEIAQGLKIAASVISYIPFIDLGASGFGGTPLFKIGTGGMNLGQATSMAGDVLSFLSQIAANDSVMASSQASFDRRWTDWKLQETLAERELDQIDRQIAAAELRVAIAERELANHLAQIENAKAVDEFMRSKFTNKELYQWQVGQISDVYFRSYKLAYDMAKRAERCFRFELGLEESNHVSFGHWDSLKKGLLAGERLQLDLRRLETAYLDQNRRDLQLTKNVSLALHDPAALVRLRDTGHCIFTLPEWLFDLDYPGHYARRIQSVSLTVPCVTGPYTTIACTLRLTGNSIRINTSLSGGYNPQEGDDDRFVQRNTPVKAIATSSGQNDSGLFELNFRDERYLPFEGTGAISDWMLELFHDDTETHGREFRQFDYATISDVVLHVKYSAREDAGPFKKEAIKQLGIRLKAADSPPLRRLFNLRQEFASEWARFVDPAAAAHTFAIPLAADLFRGMDRGKKLTIGALWLAARCTTANRVLTAAISPTSKTLTLTAKAPEDLKMDHKPIGVLVDTAGVPPTLTITSTSAPADIEDLYLVLEYNWR